MDLTSAQNPRIKHLLSLQQKSSLRREEGLFVVEGQRELHHCLAAGYQLHSLFVCPELAGSFSVPSSPLGASGVSASSSSPLGASGVFASSSSPLGASAGTAEVFTLPRSLYERMAYRGSTEGVIAIVRERRLSLSALLPSSLAAGGFPARPASVPPLFIILESVEKPGNLGAVLRSADAAAATAVIVCDPLTDLYNPNLIRASIGAIFTVPTVACTTAECIAFLKQHDIQILTAQLQDSRPYYDTPMTGPTAIVMGTESTGLTDAWRQAATAHIRIPMLGRLDSLNVSVSAAILLFEAVRQRTIQ